MWYFEEDSDGYYKIKSKQTDKCIDISGISTEDGAKLQLWSDVDGNNQKWQMEEINEEDYYEYVITSVRSNKVIDVENNSKDNGALIQQYESNGNDNQIWYIRYVDEKYFYIE